MNWARGWEQFFIACILTLGWQQFRQWEEGRHIWLEDSMVTRGEYLATTTVVVIKWKHGSYLRSDELEEEIGQ